MISSTETELDTDCMYMQLLLAITQQLCNHIAAHIEMEELKFGSVIGRGNFGVVHKGEWKGREVAIKRISLPSGTDVSLLPTPNEIAVLK